MLRSLVAPPERGRRISLSLCTHSRSYRPWNVQSHAAMCSSASTGPGIHRVLMDIHWHVYVCFTNGEREREKEEILDSHMALDSAGEAAQSTARSKHSSKQSPFERAFEGNTRVLSSKRKLARAMIIRALNGFEAYPSNDFERSVAVEHT